ncbi:MAG: histidinol dehydrogenase HisD [Candidatus Hecatellales archaeon B24]|nr:MAG: histidinol dehydrogenase HisD [Candidatus Hecatellales archaeon B24]
MDGVKLDRGRLKVSKAEVKEAYSQLSTGLVKALKKAERNIRLVHRRQLPKGRVLAKSRGIRVTQVFQPLDSVGLYIPGGRASYPSTALMLGVPARVAGVKRLVACTPPGPDGSVNPAVLAALDLAGVEEIFRVGGVQAVAAMAFGTETVPKVCKIVGPGNIYVTAAKMLVYGEVGVEFPAGPTELLVFADGEADPMLVAADLESQAEHDPRAVPVLLTISEKLAEAVYARLSKADREIREALEAHGAILLAESLEEAADFINKFAPEHLSVHAASPRRLMAKIRNVGAVSLGAYTPTAALDYALGPSHVLPTGGAARYASGISVFDFLRFYTVQSLTKRGLKDLRETVETLAEAEGLRFHKFAVEERFKRGGNVG